MYAVNWLREMDDGTLEFDTMTFKFKHEAERLVATLKICENVPEIEDIKKVSDDGTAE